MGKLYDRLQKQLKSEEYKKDVEDCRQGKEWETGWKIVG